VTGGLCSVDPGGVINVGTSSMRPSRPVTLRPAGQISSGAPSSDWLHELAASRDIVANTSVEYQKWSGQIA
jgi:hypothetical protein